MDTIITVAWFVLGVVSAVRFYWLWMRLEVMPEVRRAETDEKARSAFLEGAIPGLAIAIIIVPLWPVYVVGQCVIWLMGNYVYPLVKKGMLKTGQR